MFTEMKRRGGHFQVHYAPAPGYPDIARPSKKLPAFTYGNFWHGREIERVAAKYGPESLSPTLFT